MFYDELSHALNSTQSSGWLKVANALKLTPEELLQKVEDQTLTFEQCIEATYASTNIDLLKYVLRLFNPNFMNEWEAQETISEKMGGRREELGLRVNHYPSRLN